MVLEGDSFELLTHNYLEINPMSSCLLDSREQKWDFIQFRLSTGMGPCVGMDPTKLVTNNNYKRTYMPPSNKCSSLKALIHKNTKFTHLPI